MHRFTSILASLLLELGLRHAGDGDDTAAGHGAIRGHVGRQDVASPRQRLAGVLPAAGRVLELEAVDRDLDAVLPHLDRHPADRSQVRVVEIPAL